MDDVHKEFILNKFKVVSLMIPSGSKVLDIGCNEGGILQLLNNCDYFGVDINKEALSKINNSKTHTKVADLNLNSVPFESEKFDFVLLLDILEHVTNPQKLLKEASNRLNKNGKLIISLPNDYHILNKIRFILNKNLTEDPFAPYGHLHYFSIKVGKNFLLKNKFKIVKQVYLPPCKPKIIPKSIKSILTILFPQSFARDTIFLLAPQN